MMAGAPAFTTQQVTGVDYTTFQSYNSTGLDSTKVSFINDVFTEYNVDYASVQEHFKFVKTTNEYFVTKFPDFHSYVIPGHRSAGQDTGWAKAGLSQLARKSLVVRKERVTTSSFRIQAQVLHFPSTQVLWINTYLPTDPQNIHEYDDEELQAVLDQVRELLDTA